MKNPNCMKCIHMRGIPGDAHIECKHPIVKNNHQALRSMLAIIVGDVNNLCEELDIQGNSHGIKNGWFNWPINFDPVWLENCNGFEE